MGDLEEEIAKQRLSLLEEEGEDGRQKKRMSFWQGLFRREKVQNNDENPKEDEALLNSCPNLDFEYEGSSPFLDGSDRPASLIQESSDIDGDDEDDDDNDDDSDEK
jgi:hypothetical protein